MQKMVSALAAAVCLGSVAGIALAAEVTAEATLATPVAEAKSVVIDGRAWTCEGQKCTAENLGRSQPIARECARVARELGPLTAYRSGDRSLNADQLRACNR